MSRRVKSRPMPEPHFACPRCDSPLADIHCDACKLQFPTLDGLPCLFADPDATLGEWRNRWQLALAELEQNAEEAARALQACSDSSSTARRLQHLSSAYAEQRRLLEDLLAPLGPLEAVAKETYLALRTRLPTHQGLMSYAPNVHRDWCWGKVENQASVDAIRDIVGPHSSTKVLVLGAGAGRLAYDVHQLLEPELTVALDINPMLVLLNARMARGDTVAFFEFPLAPKTVEDCAIKRFLAAPSPAREGFRCVLADGLRPPFVDEQFDLVLTPWLLDVVDADTRQMLAHINRLLVAGGHWVNHGSVAFRRPNVEDCLTLEELTELTDANGFTTVATNEHDGPYLASPASRHARRELVSTAMAEKTGTVGKPARHQNLPEWLVTARAPIPLSPAFQSQITATQVHGFIMSLIDGKRSIRDVASVMEKERLMPARDAEAAIRGFLIKMFEESQAATRNL